MDSYTEQAIYVALALDSLAHGEFVSSGCRLFAALHYPMTISGQLLSSPVRYVLHSVPRRVHLSPSERIRLGDASAIGHLFTITSAQITAQRRPRASVANGVKRMEFLAVDLSCSRLDRSSSAYGLTKVLRKCYDAPIVVLFRHGTCILFATAYCLDPTVETEAYISRWIDCLNYDNEDLDAVVGLSYDLLPPGDSYCQFEDLTWLISREYYAIRESKEFLKYGLFSNEFLEDCFFATWHDVVEKVEHKAAYFKERDGDDFFDPEHDSTSNYKP